MYWSHQTPSSNNTRKDSTHGQYQMVNTKIRLIIFFAAKDGEALYSQQKQDRELTVAQIMNSLLPISDLNWRSRANCWTIQVWPKPNPLWLYSEVTNRFKGLDLIDRVPEELWIEVRDILQEAVIKIIPKKKGKMVVWGGLTKSWEKKRSES